MSSKTECAAGEAKKDNDSKTDATAVGVELEASMQLIRDTIDKIEMALRTGLKPMEPGSLTEEERKKLKESAGYRFCEETYRALTTLKANVSTRSMLAAVGLQPDEDNGQQIVIKSSVPSLGGLDKYWSTSTMMIYYKVL